ncbi:MAG: GNAT family N-acetyltransferase [Candidatus Binataceae bacterium]
MAVAAPRQVKVSEPHRFSGFTNDAETPALRPAATEDEGFLFVAFSAARAPDYSCIGWSDSQLDWLLRLQFRAREQSYAARFPSSHPAIVLLRGRRLGCVRLARAEQEYRVVNIEILPEFQNMNIGSAVVKEFLDEAQRNGKPVRLSVAKSNAGSVRFYSRLGFKICADDGVYLEMEFLA